MDMNNIQQKFNALKGAKFIALKNYENSFKEVENVVINTNISTKNAKLKDLEKLENLTFNDLSIIAKRNFLNLKVVEIAFNELLKAQRKNVGVFENRTDSSKKVSLAFDNQNNGTKFHLKDDTLTIYGFVISRKVLKEGNRPQRKSSEKTIAKEAIKRYCNFHMLKYRTYKLNRIKDCIEINNETIEINV